MESRLNDMENLMVNQVKSDEDCQRLTQVKGVSTITAIKAFAGDGRHFKNGRHFAANLGLVTKEHSSGGQSSMKLINRPDIRKQLNQLIRKSSLVRKSLDRIEVYIYVRMSISFMDEGFYRAYLIRCSSAHSGGELRGCLPCFS